VKRALTRWLAASLALNVALAAGLYKKTADTRQFYQQQVKYWFPSEAPEAPTTVLAEMPAQPVDLAASFVKNARPAHAYRGESGPALARWQASGRDAFAKCLNYQPKPFGREVIEAARTEFPTFTRRKLFLKSNDGVWIPAYMLTPKGATTPRPAVVALPGHDGPADATGRGAASIAGRDTNLNYMRSFGLRLAEAGYVVLAIDVAGIGELKALNYLRMVREGTLVNHSLKRVMLEEVHEATDYLLSLKEVDPARTGTVGVSLGGELAMFAGILDPRVKFVVSSGFFYSYRDYDFASMASLFIPGVLNVGDIPDLASMVAPRPMMVQLAQYDSLIKFEKARPYFEKTKNAYRAAGAPDAVTLDTFPDNHVMGVPSMLQWMKHHVPIEGRAL
jgi:hypothetical protein